MSLSAGLASKPTKFSLIGLLVGTGIAMVAAMGPLISAITITIGVETQVGRASGLPDAWMLPAALEGVGAVALTFLLTRRPAGRLRAWSVTLIFVSLGAGMAAQGAHAIWYDERSHLLTLPWNVKLFVSFVPPVSGMATLHLVVKMAEDLINTVRLLVADGASSPAATATAASVQPTGVPATNIEARVLRIVRTNPRATWRVVKDRTGLTDANAKRALTAARKRMLATLDGADEEPLTAAAAHPNGRS